jgi:hypothetical protein
MNSERCNVLQAKHWINCTDFYETCHSCKRYTVLKNVNGLNVNQAEVDFNCKFICVQIDIYDLLNMLSFSY